MSLQKLLFTEDHEWLDPGKSPARLGISDYAQKELTDVVYVELPEKGDEVRKGEVIVTLESVKATSDVYAPVDGKIIAVNTDLEAHPQKINQDPYGEGWLVELEVADPDSLKQLMNFEAYQEYLNNQGE